jgi:phage shock protein C
MSHFTYGGRRRLYRSRDGVILGVCKGLSDYFDFKVFWIRVICVILLFLSGLWPILGIYILASLIMKPKPVRPIENEDEQEFYDTYVHSKHHAAQRLKQRYQHLERRIRRMEDSVTSREYDWDRRMNS